MESEQLRDLMPKLLCGSGTAERQVAVYFFCGSGTTDFPSIIPCAKAELQTLKSHNILCTFRKTIRKSDENYIKKVNISREKMTRYKTVCYSNGGRSCILRF